MLIIHLPNHPWLAVPIVCTIVLFWLIKSAKELNEENKDIYKNHSNQNHNSQSKQ